jgi:hypothetical protein
MCTASLEAGWQALGCRARRILVPVCVLAALFRGKVLDELARARRDGKLRLAPEDEGRAAARRTDALHRASWIVYARRPGVALILSITQPWCRPVQAAA